jgi:hypothetical protein
MLSSRVVPCHKWDVFFECRTKLECQCGTRHFRYSTSGDVPVRPEIKLGRDPSKEKLCEVWEKVFKDYSMLMLTDLGDKLPALSGIAKLFASNLDQESNTIKIEYLAGLWRPLLPQTLLWYAATTIAGEAINHQHRITRLPGPGQVSTTQLKAEAKGCRIRTLQSMMSGVAFLGRILSGESLTAVYVFGDYIYNILS